MFKILIRFLKFWKVFAVIIALLCTIIWLGHVFSADFFHSLTNFLRTFINLIKNAPVGLLYLFAALGISFFITVPILNKLQIIEKIKSSEKIAKRLKTKQMVKKAVKIAQKTEFIDIGEFFGLFEFDFSENIKNDDLETLKSRYCKMIKEKIKDKYPNTDFQISDKIFFIEKNFLLIDSITNDLTALFNILKNVNEQKNIKTDLLLSFYGSTQKISHQRALKVLSEINELKNANKIIISQDVYVKYFQENNDCSSFIPLTKFKLNSINKNTQLYYKNF